MASSSAKDWRVAFLIPSLIVGTLVSVLVVWCAAVFLLRPPSAPVFNPAVAHTTWQQEIYRRVGPLSSRSSSQEIAAVLKDVLALQVTAEDRDAHLALVLALTAFEHGSPDAYAQVRVAFDRVQQ